MKPTPPADVSHLLKPRYKVISDYPSCPFSIGEILWKGKVEYDWHFDREKFIDIKKWPHLFKPLAWYEEREESEMPEYIRLNQIMVVRVAKHHCMKHDEFQAHDTKYNYPYDICAPATQSEYETYIKRNNEKTNTPG